MLDACRASGHALSLHSLMQKYCMIKTIRHQKCVLIFFCTYRLLNLKTVNSWTPEASEMEGLCVQKSVWTKMEIGCQLENMRILLQKGYKTSSARPALWFRLWEKTWHPSSLCCSFHFHFLSNLNNYNGFNLITKTVIFGFVGHDQLLVEYCPVPLQAR